MNIERFSENHKNLNSAELVMKQINEIDTSPFGAKNSLQTPFEIPHSVSQIFLRINLDTNAIFHNRH